MSMSISPSKPWFSSLLGRARISDQDTQRGVPTASAAAVRRIPRSAPPRNEPEPTRGRPRLQDAARLAEAAPRTIPVATIFHEPWWLDTASDGAYQEATVEANGVVIGRLPYLLSKKLGGQTALVMPAMTHALGPSLTADLAGVHLTRSLKSFTICGELIAQLPRASHIWFECHGQVTDTLAFEAAGFSSGVRFTIEIAPGPLDTLWRQMRDKTRNVIRRAEESLTVREVGDPKIFLDFYEDNLRRRGLRNNYDRRICGNLMAEAIRRGAGRLLVATDKSGAMQSGIFTVWDHGSEYYLMSTRSRDSSNGAISLLLWTAIQHAAGAGLKFDMDGVDSKKNLLLLTGFGGALRPRYFVQKTSTAFHVAQHIKAVWAHRGH